jgi:transposase-like protein
MAQAKTISGLAKELGIRRKYLYEWRHQLAVGGRAALERRRGRSPDSQSKTVSQPGPSASELRILTCANAHFGGSIQNFYRSESQLGEHGGMAVTPLEVMDGHLKVPTGPGLGLDINSDFLKQNLSPGEVYWG